MTLYASLLGVSFLLVKLTCPTPPSAAKQPPSFVINHLMGTLVTIGCFVGALISANVVAFVMDSVLNKPLSWFSKELSCVALYVPPALAGKPGMP